MEDFEKALHSLNNKVPPADEAALFRSIMERAGQRQEAKVSFIKLKNMTLVAIALVAINLSAIVWHSKTAGTTQEQKTSYMQTYNLSIY